MVNIAPIKMHFLLGMVCHWVNPTLKKMGYLIHKYKMEAYVSADVDWLLFHGFKLEALSFQTSCTQRFWDPVWHPRFIVAPASPEMGLSKHGVPQSLMFKACMSIPIYFLHGIINP